MAVSCGDNVPKYKDASLGPADRARDLVGRMTLEEKIGQLISPYGWEMFERRGEEVVLTDHFRETVGERHAGMFWGTFRADPWTRRDLETGLDPHMAARLANMMQRYVVENTRLGIPLFLAEEAPHGHMAIGATVFPTAIGQASTWNPALIERMGGLISREIRLQGGHISYGPVLDISRDPRWSRVEECYGEDPVLTALMGAAFVRGSGGGNLALPGSTVSTLKHFIAYGVSDGGQNGGSNLIGERELRSVYLPPFKAAVDAGALSVMTAYCSVDGVPCTANRHMLTDVLRDEWGFGGFVISDLVSIEGLAETHNVAGSVAEAGAMAMDAGVDVDLCGGAFAHLAAEVRAGRVKEEQIDRAVERVLKLKFEMGLFENPYVDEAATVSVGDDGGRALAREVAWESVTLLKNDGVLPLKPSMRVAVIGPNADNVYNQLGDYTAQQRDVVTVLDGIRERVPSAVYARGCAVRDMDDSGIAQAVAAARAADVAVVVVGGSSARDFKTQYLATGAATVSAQSVSDMECGEGFDRATLSLMGRQEELLRAVKATGRPVVVVYIQGRPLDMTWASDNASALMTAWYPGQEGGDAVAAALFGEYSPAGRLPVGIPRSVGQLPVYYNKKRPANHDYADCKAAPLYPFGYGLSYTSFEYGDMRVAPAGKGGYSVEFTVRNTGGCDGDEVVQLYMRDEVSSVVQPVKQLCRFERAHIKRGESRTFRFILSRSDFAVIGRDMKERVEPGAFTLTVGPSSAEIRLSHGLEIVD